MKKSVFSIASLLFLNTLVAQSTYVYAVSGVSNDSNDLLTAWILTNFLFILGSGVYSFVADRFPRLKLSRTIFIMLGILYAATFILQQTAEPTNTVFIALLTLADQQYVVLPIAIWAIVGDIFNASEAQNHNRTITAGDVIGGIIGNGIFTFAALNITDYLMAANAVLMFAAAGVTFISRDELTPTRTKTRKPTYNSIADIVTGGMKFIAARNFMKLLVVAMILIGFGLNVVEYHLVVFAANSVSSENFSLFYGVIRMARLVGVLLLIPIVQRLLKSMSLQKKFYILPVVMVACLALMLVPQLWAIALAQIVVRGANTLIAEPNRNSLFSMIPVEVQGRVQAVISGMTFSFGSIVSCLFILGIRVPALNIQNEAPIYIVSGIIASAIAFVIVRRMDKSYEEFLWDAGLKRNEKNQKSLRRRQRSSEVMSSIHDKLDF